MEFNEGRKISAKSSEELAPSVVRPAEELCECNEICASSLSMIVIKLTLTLLPRKIERSCTFMFLADAIMESLRWEPPGCCEITLPISIHVAHLAQHDPTRRVDDRRLTGLAPRRQSVSRAPSARLAWPIGCACSPLRFFFYFSFFPNINDSRCSDGTGFSEREKSVFHMQPVYEISCDLIWPDDYNWDSEIQRYRVKISEDRRD